jgi:hypothetical protein
MADVVPSVLVLVLSVVLASFVIQSYRDSERSLLWASFAGHQASAVIIVIVTGAFYGWGDLLGYHRLGTFLAQRLRDDFTGMLPTLTSVLFQTAAPLPFPGVAVSSNTGSMQAMSGFLCFLCGDSVYAVCMTIAAASFFAKMAIYRVLSTELPDVSSTALLIASVLVPSAVFWSSGLLKEPIAVVGLAAMIHGAYGIVRHGKYVSGGAWLLGGALVTGLFKGYLLPPFGIGAGFFLASRAVFAGGRAVRPGYLLLALVVAGGFVAATGMVLPHFSPDIFAEEARGAQTVGQRTMGGSNYALGGGTLAGQLPLAVATVLYRPLIFEAGNALVAINALEMTVALVLTIKLLFRGPLGELMLYVLRRPALCFCFGFALTLAIGVGLTTTNLGTLSRYRMPLIPFYGALLTVLATRPVSRAARPGASIAVPPWRPAA